MSIFTPTLIRRAKQPVKDQLAHAFESSFTRRAGRSRQPPGYVDIVSEKACDDIIKFLGPSLDRHKGCDIIDIHPGCCLWSRKLHEYLKPRCHLLLEPAELYYEPFIKPLLDQPGSRYRFTELSGAHPTSYWATYSKIFNDELLPKRKALSNDDPQLRENNDSLLVTGSLFRPYGNKTSNRTNSVIDANLILGHMLQASQTNSLFHAYGLTRMLFWHPEQTREAVLPRGLHARRAFSTSLDMAADMTTVATIHEDAVKRKVKENGDPAFAGQVRCQEVTERSVDLTLQRMERNGLVIPPHRRNPHHRAALERHAKNAKKPASRSTIARTIHSHSPPISVSHLKEEIQGLFEAREYYEQVTSRPSKKIVEPSDTSECEFQYPRDLGSPINPQAQRKLGPLMDINSRQIRLEEAFAHLKANSPESSSTALESQLVESARKVRALVNPGVKRPTAITRTFVLWDEARALENDSSLLAWDRRPYEPLHLERDEFWPKHSLYLLDIQPRKQNFASDITSATEGNIVMRELIQILFSRQTTALPVALERIAPNAGKDLIETTPIFRDPLRAGRLDPHDLSVKMLTREMLDALVRSFLEWPFRPSTADLAFQDEDLSATKGQKYSNSFV